MIIWPLIQDDLDNPVTDLMMLTITFINPGCLQIWQNEIP